MRLNLEIGNWRLEGKSEETELHCIACHQDGGSHGFRRQTQKRKAPPVGGHWLIPLSPWVMRLDAWEPSVATNAYSYPIANPNSSKVI
jgi:hypothetical protein